MKNLLLILVVLLVLAGGAVGYLAKVNALQVSMSKDVYSFSEPVSFTVRNMSLKTAYYVPCLNGVDTEKKEGESWTNYGKVVFECEGESGNQMIKPLGSVTFTVDVSESSGGVAKQIARNRVEQALSGVYRLAFEYWFGAKADSAEGTAVAEPEKMQAYSEAFELKGETAE